MTPSIFERFIKFVDADGDCWLWTGGTSGGGYGSFRAVGRKKILAHRWLWEYLVGPIPEGLEMDHLCRMPRCVNPDHLEPVTHRENLGRMKRRGPGEFCLHGHLRADHETWWRPKDKKPYRACLACHRERDRKRRSKTVAL